MTPANEALTHLGMLAKESGLVHVLNGKVAPEHEAKVASHPYQGRLRRLVQEASEFEADYIYFRLHPGTGAPRAEVFIFDCTKPASALLNEAERRLQLWNYGQVPLMYVLRRDGVHIYSLLSKPELDDLGMPKLTVIAQLMLAADTASEIEHDKWEQYRAHRFDNGTFWEDNPLLKDAETSVKSLVNEVREARLQVEQQTMDWNDPALCKRLMIFVIMARFLEERGILNEDYFKNANVNATRFENIVGIPGALARVLGMLEHDLNGDVFRLRDGLNGGPTERERITSLTADQLAPIADFAKGRSIRGQMHFWKLYRFDYLPVEAMSYIYEDFLGGEDNAYYTPQLLAELLLDEAMEPDRVLGALRTWKLGDEAPFRLIDPSCGSGVFLVGAWRRLVETWRVLHSDKVPGIEVLSALMKQNIFGVDIKPDAIDLTCFSLSVALCAELMRDSKGDASSVIAELRKHKLPSLKAGLHGNNLYAKDFFEQLESGLPHAGSFSLVIGNPPFDATASAIAERVSTTPTLGMTESLPWPLGVPGNQICYHFLREAPRLLKDRGIACLIQKDSFLYNLGPEDFRAVLFRNWRVPQILDFISVRHLFDAAKTGGGKVDTKVVAVFIEAAPPQEGDIITHVTFRKVNAVEKRLFFEVDTYDIHRVPLNVAMSDSKVWKSNLLGGGRLLQTYHTVKGSQTVESFLQSKNYVTNRPKSGFQDYDHDKDALPSLWMCTEGFQANNGNRHRQHRKGLKCLNANTFNVDSCDSPPTYENQVEWFEYPKDFAIFCAPHLVIRQHESLPSLYRSAECLEPLLFGQTFVGIRCPLEDQTELLRLANYFREYREDLMFFSAFGLQSLINRAVPTLADILALPYPEDGKLHFRGVEPVLRNDVLNHMIPLIKYGTGRKETAHLIKPATKSQLQAFSDTLVQVMRNTWKTIKETQVTDLVTAWCIAYSLDASENPSPRLMLETKEHLIARLDKLLEHRSSPHLRFRRVVRVFEDNTFYLIKPKDYRYWLGSVAVRDADEVIGYLMSRAISNSSLSKDCA